MSAATDALETQILNLVFPSNQAWISLHGADPGETGTASAEITGGAYTRKQATITITGNTASLNQTITWEGMPEGVALETLTVTDLGDGWTRLHSTSLTDSFEGRDAWLASGMEVGVNDGYAKLDGLLADGAA